MARTIKQRNKKTFENRDKDKFNFKKVTLTKLKEKELDYEIKKVKS